MEQAKWFDRKFDFSYTQNIFPSIMERLAGTPARLEEKIKNISPEILELKLNDSWSIKENIGHLTDLEPLWQGRLEDFLAGRTMLRAADLQNNKTNEAGHNSVAIDVLLKDFRAVRMQTMEMLNALTSEQIYLTSLHPRLQTPMRVMDSFLFVAEHDDHHLARITEISRSRA